MQKMATLLRSTTKWYIITSSYPGGETPGGNVWTKQCECDQCY